MKLTNIQIENYKSIEKINLAIEEIDSGYTYSLIGINESGKSSLLKAISLINSTEGIVHPQDFYNPDLPVSITFEYLLDETALVDIKEILKQVGIEPDDADKLDLSNKLFIRTEFNPSTPGSAGRTLGFQEHNIVKEYTAVEGGRIVKKEGENAEGEDLDVQEFLKNNKTDFIYQLAHKVIFWNSDPKFIITEPIDLDAFVADPQNTSIPLKNSFELSGIENITEKINKIKGNSAEINNLQELLGDSVTSHIKKIWPQHPVKIKFHISDNKINFLVEDEKVKYKSKTTNQRSDGFRQMISFLLTISAESSNSKLSNTLLLLDEPEVHLHPQGQENLKDELIKISGDGLNNIVIFATHSNFMIDKEKLDRCYGLRKKGNDKTEISKFDGENTSYSEINYRVFEIPTADYHNELYGFVEANNPNSLQELKKDRSWKNAKSGKTEKVSLPTYIRHSIHHPENKKNDDFKIDELIESIEILKELKYGPESD